MKKQLFAILTLFLFLCSGIEAFEDYTDQPLFPHPLGGHVKHNNIGLSNVLVTCTNERTGYGESTSTNQEGAFLFELANWKVNNQGEFPYSLGDTIICIALGESKSVVLEGGSDVVSFDIASADVKECPDGSVVLIDEECPEVPEEEEEKEEEVDIKVVANDDKTSANFDVPYGYEFEVEVKDNKLGKLKDNEIKHEGDEYNIHEEITLKGKVLTSIDDEEYTVPVLTIDKNDFVYTYYFDDGISFDEIEGDELEITFLGKRLVITEVHDDLFKIKSGEEYTLGLDSEDCIVRTEGDICIVNVDNDKARISVGDKQETIEEGHTERIGDIEIYVDEVWDEDPKEVVIIYDEDVIRSVSDGEGYADEDDEEWEYSFTTENSKLKSISVSNSNDFTDLEDKKEFYPLKVGEELSLPNNFAAIKFTSIPDYDEVELEFEEDEGYLYVSGDFEINSDDYEELWIKEDGFYDGDFELITTENVRIGESDFYLELGNSVSIGKLTIKTDLSDILYDGVSIANKDEEEYLTHEGITFTNPEQALEDKDGFVVTVPNTDEDFEVTLSITKTTEEKAQPEKQPIEPSEQEGDTEAETPGDIVVPEEPVVEEEPTPTPPIEPVEPEPEVKPEPKGTNWGLIIGIIAIIVIAGLIYWFGFKKKK